MAETYLFITYSVRQKAVMHNKTMSNVKLVAAMLDFYSTLDYHDYYTLIIASIPVCTVIINQIKINLEVKVNILITHRMSTEGKG